MVLVARAVCKAVAHLLYWFYRYWVLLLVTAITVVVTTDRFSRVLATK